MAFFGWMTEVQVLRYPNVVSRPARPSSRPGLHMSTHNCRACGSENEQSAKFCGSCGRDLFDPSVGADRIGSTIVNRYTIRRVIAVGGMGVVYEADQALAEYHRTVAIKMLRPELSHDQIVVSRFNRECGIVAQLSHQNIVRLFDYGAAEDGTLYIAMEFVRGQSLAAAIASGPLPIERTLHIFEQMCHGLHEAHELGIVHRDLKPDNVVLTQHGSQVDFVKLLDFGIAARLSAGTAHETKLTQQGMILGTPPYMSPEQFTGAPVTRRSDVYSLGIMLYEALTGQLPFTADNPWMWAQRHLTSIPPQLPASFPPAMVATVRAALAKDPSERPASALEMYQRLVGTIGVQSRESHPPSDAGSPVPRETPTQPDAPNPTPVVTERPRRDTPTDPAEPPIMAGGVPLFANVRAPERYELPAREAVRRRIRIGAVIALCFALCAGGLSLAYWLDWIDLPFQGSEPANPGPTSAQNSQVPASEGLATVQRGPELAPSPQTPGADQSAAETKNNSARVAGSHSSSSVQHGSTAASPSNTAAPTSAPSATSGGVSWPPSITGLPTSLPSLPSGFPPLPSSIAGIPLPPIFQAPPPSPSTSSDSPSQPNP